jgi:hypothetical protein
MGLSLVLPLLLAACVSTPNAGGNFLEGLTPPKAVTDAFARFTVPRKFREAVAAKDWVTARQLHAEHGTLLATETPNEVALFARQVTGEWEPRLRSARQGVDAALAQGPVAWTAALAQAREVQQGYQRESLPGPANDEAVALKKMIDDAPATFAQRAPSWFAAHPHADAGLFFSTVPFTLDVDARREIVAAQLPVLATEIARADPAKAKELTSTYGALLSPDQRKTLDQAYATRVAVARFGRSTSLTPVQALAVQRAVAEAGGTAAGVRALVLQGLVDATVTLDGERIQQAVAPERIDQELRSAAAAGQRFVVLVDPQQAAVTEWREPRLDRERRQAGTRSVPNPEYDNARRELQRLEEEHRQVTEQNEQIKRQAQDLGRQGGVRGIGAFGAVLGVSAGQFAVNESRKQVDEARATLARTPRTIQQPVYADAQVAVVTRQSETITRPAVYLVDTEGRQFWKTAKTDTDVSRSTVPAAQAGGSATAAPSASVDLRMEDIGASLESASAAPTSALRGAIANERASFQQATARRQQEASQRSSEARRQLAALGGQERATAQRTAATTGGTSSGGGGAGGSCPTTLAHLESRIPQFRVSTLQTVRSELFRIDVVDEMGKFKARGLSADAAIDETLQNARTYETEMKKAGSCAAAFDAYGSSDEAFLNGIRSGELASLSSCDGIRNACLCMGMTLRLGAVAMRAAAAVMQCHARAGRW